MDDFDANDIPEARIEGETLIQFAEFYHREKIKDLLINFLEHLFSDGDKKEQKLIVDKYLKEFNIK